MVEVAVLLGVLTQAKGKNMKLFLTVVMSLCCAMLIGCTQELHQPNMQQITQSYSQAPLQTPTGKPAGQLASKKGYLCTANNKLVKAKASTAWSHNLLDAKAYALSRCESHSAHADACKIESCTPTATTTTVAKDRWFTCYVPNHNESGVWSSTSHTRLTAVKVAYDRCVQFSSKAKSCYLSYCRIW